MKLVYDTIEIFIPLEDHDESSPELVSAIGQKGAEMIGFFDGLGLDGIAFFVHMLNDLCEARSGLLIKPTAQEILDAIQAHRENPTPFYGGTIPGVWVKTKVVKRVFEPVYEATPSLREKPSTLAKPLSVAPARKIAPPIFKMKMR